MSLKRLSRGALRFILLLCVPAIVIGAAAYIYLTGGRYVSTENAYVKADIVQISPDLDGRVTDVLVRDHDTVNAGEVLFRLDPAPFRIAVAKAEADLAKVATTFMHMRAELAEAQTEVGEFRSRIGYYTKTAKRQRNLLKRGVTTRSTADAAELELSVARERLRTARAKVQRLEAALGGNPDLPLPERALYRERAAVLEAAKLDLARTVIRAPTPGIISNMRLQVGEHLETGDPAFSLIVDRTHWVVANLKETELTHIELGQHATVTPDAYPDVKITAVVDSISPATGAEFAILPPQNATGNWVKVVQRLPVRLRLEPGPGLELLRAGMSVEAVIDTERQRDSLVALKSNWSAIAGEKPADQGVIITRPN